MTDDPQDLPPHLRPFVLPMSRSRPAASATSTSPTREGAGTLPLVLDRPHRCPVPKDREIRPPQWPAYPAYGALLAQAGLVGGMFEHGFVDDDTLDVARDDVAAALALGPTRASTATGSASGSSRPGVPDGLLPRAGPRRRRRSRRHLRSRRRRGAARHRAGRRHRGRAAINGAAAPRAPEHDLDWIVCRSPTSCSSGAPRPVATSR